MTLSSNLLHDIKSFKKIEIGRRPQNFYKEDYLIWTYGLVLMTLSLNLLRDIKRIEKFKIGRRPQNFEKEDDL